MAKPSYMTSGVDADAVRLIKDGAIFIRETSTTDIPASDSWVPADPTTQLGYYGEDGVQVTPNPGDSTELVGHNGDILIVEQSPGYWTVQFGGLEANDVNVGAYFDTEVAGDGSVTVTKASASKRWDIVIAGFDNQERMIVAHFPNVQLDSREAVTLNRTTLVILNMTFRTFIGRPAAPYHFKAWGLTSPASPDSGTDWTTQITGTPTGGVFQLVIDGYATPDVAYDANNAAYEAAVNGLSGVTGVTVAVTGTTTKALAFSAAVNLQANAAGLTGGTSPGITVTKV